MRLGTLGEWRAWMVRGWPLWCSALLVGAGWLTWHLSNGSEDALRRLGLGYEVLGAMVVLADMLAAMKRHNVGSPVARLKAYLREIPCLRAMKTVNLSGGSSSIIAVSGKSRGISSTGPNSTVEQRLSHLEGRLAALDVQFDQMGEKIAAEGAARKVALAAEAEQRIAAEESNAEVVKRIEVGSVGVALFGLLWLLIGMILTTATTEVCDWVLGCSK